MVCCQDVSSTMDIELLMGKSLTSSHPKHLKTSSSLKFIDLSRHTERMCSASITKIRII